MHDRSNMACGSCGFENKSIMSALKKVVLSDAFSRFTGTRSPRMGGDINKFRIKLANVEGELRWHPHENDDELFLGYQGRPRMKLGEADGGGRGPQRRRGNNHSARC